MQAQNRLVKVPTRQIALGAALVVAVALVALVLLAVTVRSAQPATTVTHVVVAHEQAPDAQERNEQYSRALAARFNNQSPDAQERNIQLSGR
jgi:hypothetical protein